MNADRILRRDYEPFRAEALSYFSIETLNKVYILGMAAQAAQGTMIFENWGKQQLDVGS